MISLLLLLVLLPWTSMAASPIYPQPTPLCYELFLNQPYERPQPVMDRTRVLQVDVKEDDSVVFQECQKGRACQFLFQVESNEGFKGLRMFLARTAIATDKNNPINKLEDFSYNLPGPILGFAGASWLLLRSHNKDKTLSRRDLFKRFSFLGSATAAGLFINTGIDTQHSVETNAELLAATWTALYKFPNIFGEVPALTFFNDIRNRMYNVETERHRLPAEYWDLLYFVAKHWDGKGLPLAGSKNLK